MTSKLKNRKKVEIYFILYLAALILLIPKQKESLQTDDESIKKVFSIPFSLKAEKPNLVCRLKRDSNKISIAFLDSSNVVYYEGDVSDVKYEFLIEDQLRKQSLNLDGKTQNTSRFFKFEENSDNQSAVFYWNPKNQDLINNNYLVKVIATGKLTDTSGNSQTVISKTQFSLNMLFDNEALVVINDMIVSASDSNSSNDSTGLNNLALLPLLNRFLADPELIVQDPKILSFERTDWTNTIYTFNLNPTTDLNGSPIINIVGANRKIADQIKIVGYSNNSISISGKTPVKNSMKVSIQLERKYDNSVVSVDFRVKPVSFEKPKIPEYMNPDREYDFDPKLPIITRKEMSVRITQNGVVKYSNTQGGKFKFSVPASEVNKPIIFERLVDGELIGKRYMIEIRKYPAPEVRGMLSKGTNKQMIRTTSFGESNGQPNYVKELIIINGKVSVREIYGNESSNKKENIHYQEFEVKNKINKAQVVHYQLIDKSGVKSKKYRLSFE